MTDWTHGGEFPIANISCVQTVGIEQMQAQFARLIRPHDVRLTDQQTNFVSELRYAPLSRSVLSSADVGAAMKVNARPAGDLCLVFGAVNCPLHMTIGRRRTVIPVGAIDIVPPDVPFEMDIPHSRCRSVMFVVERSYLESIIAAESGQDVQTPLSFLDGIPHCTPDEQSFVELLNFVQEELKAREGRCRSSAYLVRLEELMASALLNTKDHNYSQILSTTNVVAEPRCVRRAVDYMMAHAGENLTLGDIAALVAVSPRTLTRGFVKYKNCSPMSYLRRVRMDNCRRDLLQALPEDTSVTAVAIKWGFSNIGRFASRYCERFGESPIATLKRRL